MVKVSHEIIYEIDIDGELFPCKTPIVMERMGSKVYLNQTLAGKPVGIKYFINEPGGLRKKLSKLLHKFGIFYNKKNRILIDELRYKDFI